ncbi:arginase family protein [Glutamicibacter nicotianae]|uniref:arginase family protein n=1 Tax=Glutamicibacter nicotianae TaxID=37929 RepID=UPI001959D0EB|nr:arginase family protein [Glutamicibacter nicotianae]MBM7767722.1 arginase [Glutamicibacter nicotianae]
MTNWDLQLVVPLWQGSGEPGIAQGATRLAEMLAPSTVRHLVEPDFGTPDTHQNNGDYPLIENHDAVEAHLAAASNALRVLEPSSLLTLGGDCTVEVASVSHMASIHPELHVVWIDAHADLNTPESSPSGHAHGMPLRALFGDGHPDLVPSTTLSQQRCALLGTRSMDPPEQAFIAAHELPVINPEQLQNEPDLLEELLVRWLPDGAPLYVHLDLDVLDPSVWPAVAVPEPGGLGIATLVAVINSLRARGNLVGVGITEYVPGVDHDPSTLWPVLDALGIAVHGRDDNEAREE